MLKTAAVAAAAALVLAGAALAGRYLIMQPTDLFVYPPAREACYARPNVAGVAVLSCLDPDRRFGRQQIIEVRMSDRVIEVIHFDRRGRPRVLFRVRRR